MVNDSTNMKKTNSYISALDRHKNVAGLNRVMESQPSYLKKNWIFFGNTDINKQEKSYTDFLPLLIYYHKNELNISMDSKIAASVNAPSLFITS
jgi:hypothetical protein